MHFRPDIQGLRAVAVLAMLIFQLNSAWLSGGFFGVDIFLVISGYLIADFLLYKKVKVGYHLLSSLGHFYRSRLKRIMPAYFTTLAAALTIWLNRDNKISAILPGKNGLDWWVILFAVSVALAGTSLYAVLHGNRKAHSAEIF